MVPALSQEDIDLGLMQAGGRAAVDPWLVDGKTKINHNGSRAVVTVDESAAATGASSDPRAAALTSLARFGLGEEALDSGSDQIRQSLRDAARQATNENPNLSLAIEYALEDAFSKVTDWENAQNGAAPGMSAPGMNYDQRLAANTAQADQVKAQLKLDGGADWGVDSLAQDLAVFDMDLTAMNKNPYELAQSLRDKAKDLLADLDRRSTGTEVDGGAARRRITGACARLCNGLEGSGGATALAVSSQVSASATVSVGGVSINASSILAAGNVLVDPLVLDLNGDGLNLKGADEGVDFDMNGDGTATRMGFIRGDDALLFVDTHGDGVVHDGRQLFGNTDGHANGFEKLRSYDDNGDGVIDEKDAIFDQLRLWVEKTEDGVCEEGETMSLREAGVKSINVGYADVREDDGTGNIIGQKGGFTRDDGTGGLAADVWFQEKQG